MANDDQVLYRGKHVELIDRDGWTFAHRPTATGIVAIVAVTDARELVLIEQFRKPVNATVIEIPAGLAGDVVGSETEALAAAASRELLEETGYAAATITRLVVGTSSAGITDELITLFLATGLTKVGDGAGDGSEQITTTRVPLDEVEAWVAQRVDAGAQVDLKVYAALHFARRV